MFTDRFILPLTLISSMCLQALTISSIVSSVVGITVGPSNTASTLNKRSYMSAHVLMNVLNELRKSDKMQGLSSILLLFRNEFNKFNNTV